MSNEKQKQLVEQCKVVAHMAKVIARVHSDLAKLYAVHKESDDFTDMVGRWTAERMEILGDILNGMDAVDADEDAWTYPIFEEARRLWPAKRDNAP